MGFRCELCDEWLPMLQFSKLCPTCYKIRTIVKCYSAQEILEHLEKNFLVSHAREEEFKRKDKQFFIEEEKRLEKVFNEEMAKLKDERESNDLKDYDKPKIDKEEVKEKARKFQKKK